LPCKIKVKAMQHFERMSPIPNTLINIKSHFGHYNARTHGILHNIMRWIIG
jgi:hypothetical protein